MSESLHLSSSVVQSPALSLSLSHTPRLNEPDITTFRSNSALSLYIFITVTHLRIKSLSPLKLRQNLQVCHVSCRLYRKLRARASVRWSLTYRRNILKSCWRRRSQRCFSQPFVTFTNFTVFSLILCLFWAVILMYFVWQVIVQMSVEFAQHTEHTRLNKQARETSTSTQTLNAEDQRPTDHQSDAVSMATSRQHTQVSSQHMEDVDWADWTGFRTHSDLCFNLMTDWL